MLGLSGISRPYGARELVALLIFSCAMAAGPSISTAGNVWGASTDIPVFGDFDGDGKSDIAVWRPSTGYWYIIQSSNGAIVAKQWGAPSDVPVVGDFDGDGKTDIAVWRPSTGYWYILQSSNGAIVAKQWGAPSDAFRFSIMRTRSSAERVGVRVAGNDLDLQLAQ
jgi:hypothetical protein